MMILYGGKRSPFVRRIELWLAVQERSIERAYINLFGAEFEGFKAKNPLGRVPVLTIAPDEHLIETAAIIDYLEETAPAAKRLIPPSGTARRHCNQRIAIANGLVEKGVALVYETERRPAELQWPDWRARLEGQLAGGLAALEAVTPATGWMGGDAMDGSDIAAVCAYDFLLGTKATPNTGQYPRLEALAARANEHPAFAATHPKHA